MLIIFPAWISLPDKIQDTKHSAEFEFQIKKWILKKKRKDYLLLIFASNIPILKNYFVGLETLRPELTSLILKPITF